MVQLSVYLKGKKEMEEDFITYDPVAGLTILQAIEKAINLAKTNDKTVKANINDVDMTFTKETKAPEALILFHKRLDALYAKEATHQKD